MRVAARVLPLLLLAHGLGDEEIVDTQSTIAIYLMSTLHGEDSFNYFEARVVHGAVHTYGKGFPRLAAVIDLP